MAEFRGLSFLLFLFFFFFFNVSDALSLGEQENLLTLQEEMLRTAGYGDEKLSSVLVTGTVICDACLRGEVETRALHVSGALVGVACKTGGKRRKLNWAQGKTDEYGDFIIDLPSHLHASPHLDKACTVRIVRMPKGSPCRRLSTTKMKAIRLSSVGNGIRTYTAGVMRFQQHYSKPWHVCIKKAGENEEERPW